MTDPLERVLIQSFRLSMVFLASSLLTALQPKLKKAEKEYLEVYGPRIVRFTLKHQSLLWGADKDVKKHVRIRDMLMELERSANERLRRSGVSKKRQQMLLHLTWILIDFSAEPIKISMNLSQVEQWIIDEGYVRKLIGQYRKVAKAGRVPTFILRFLDVLEDEGFKLVAQRHQKERRDRRKGK